MPTTTSTVFPSYARDIVWGLFYFALYLLVNAYLITRADLSIDEVIDFHGSNSDIYIAAGRWGLYGYRYLMGQGIFPITAGIIAGLFISTAILIQTKIFNFNHYFTKASYGLLYIACNQWSSQLVYSFQSDAVACALLLCTIGVYKLQRHQCYTIPVICLTLALSAYQSCATYFLIIYCASIIANKDISIKSIFLSACVFIIACALYFLISHILKNSDLLRPATRVYVSGYQSAICGWGTFPALSIIAKIQFFLHYCKVTLTEAVGFGALASPLQISTLIPLGYLVTTNFLKNNGYQRFIHPLIITIIWVLPFTMHLLIAGATETRTLLGEPVALAFLWSMSCNSMHIPRLGRMIFTGILTFFLLKAAYTNTATSRNNAYIYSRAVHELQSIHLSGKLLARERQLLPKTPIILLVHPSAQENLTRPLSSHRDFIIERTLSGSIRWHINHLRLTGMTKGNAEHLEKHKEALQTMTCWPEPGSMIVNKGDIIVRIHP